MKPKVSILMNCYNCEKYLKEAIDSIYAQTYQNFEIIFIDNCSTDNSANIAKSYDNKLKYYKLDSFSSLGSARNFGIKKCYGDYIGFLDTDDMWLPEKLEIQIEVLEKNKDFQLCFGGAFFIDKNGKINGKFIPKSKSGYIFKDMLLRYEINMQTVLLRNNINISFNENLEFSPDYDLFMNIVSISKAGVINKPVVKYRKLSDSLTIKKIDKWWIENKFTLDKILDKHPELEKLFQYEIKYAYAKIDYYKARYLIFSNKKKEARCILSRIK